MKRIGESMPLTRGGPPRVELVDPGRLENVRVVVDGNTVHTFPNGAALKDGWAGELPDGSRLDVGLRRRYGSLLPRFDVRRDGRALPLSGWDPARLVTNASNLLFALGAWPLLDLATANKPHPYVLGQAILLVILGALARTKKRAVVVPALWASVVVLFVHTALILLADRIGWALFHLLFVMWMIRDARAASDLDVTPSAAPPKAASSSALRSSERAP